MTDHDYHRFCHALIEELEGSDPDAFAQSGSLQVDGMDVGLFLQPGAQDTFCCYIDVGPFDPVDRAHVFQELLKLNLLTGSKSNGVFAIDPRSEHVLLVAHVTADAAMSPQRLAIGLRSYVRLAREIRDALLLPPTSGGRASPVAIYPDFC